MIELIEIVLAGEDRSVADHLGENASDRPDVNRLGVALRVQHDLRRPVPPGGHVLGEEAGVIVGRVGDARKPEVANLHVEGKRCGES